MTGSGAAVAASGSANATAPTKPQRTFFIPLPFLPRSVRARFHPSSPQVSPNAGKPGFGPYRTYLVRDLAPRRFTALAATLGLEAVYEDADAPALPLPRLLRFAWSAAGVLGRLVTLGRWDPLESERIFVFRKIEAPRT
jgi:hypothetical protein